MRIHNINQLYTSRPDLVSREYPEDLFLGEGGRTFSADGFSNASGSPRYQLCAIKCNFKRKSQRAACFEECHRLYDYGYESGASAPSAQQQAEMNAAIEQEFKRQKTQQTLIWVGVASVVAIGGYFAYKKFVKK